MSKKRRTRKEKLTALGRHNFRTIIAGEKHEITIVAPKEAVNTANTQTLSYAHIPQDIRSTVFITTILVGINIIIFTLLRLKLINLFGLVF